MFYVTKKTKVNTLVFFVLIVWLFGNLIVLALLKILIGIIKINKINLRACIGEASCIIISYFHIM